MITEDLKITKEQRKKLIKNNEEPIGIAMEKYEVENEKIIKDKALNRLDNLEKEAIQRKKNKALGIKTKKSKKEDKK